MGMPSAIIAVAITAKTAVVITVIAAVVLSAVSVTPMGGGTPIATSPYPAIVAPSPSAPNPNISRRGTDRRDLNDGCWGGRCDNNRRRSHDYGSGRNHDRGRKRDANAETDMYPCIQSGDAHCCQGQNCNRLFHNDFHSYF